MILEPPKIKPDTVSTVSPSISHEVMGPDAMIFVSAHLSAGGCEEVRGSGLECQAAMAQERLRGATLPPRSVAAGRTYPMSKVRGSGREELPCV